MIKLKNVSVLNFIKWTQRVEKLIKDLLQYYITLELLPFFAIISAVFIHIFVQIKSLNTYLFSSY